MRALEELDINLGGDFILMAATLIHIKSKMLLPPDPEEIREGEPGGPPRGVGTATVGA